MESSDGLQIGAPLRPDELPFAQALVAEAGWNQTADDWRAFLALGKVLAIRAGGEVVATAATLPYGGRFAWISMVLVTKRFQRRGLATRLLRQCVADIQAAGLVPVLDATPAGREVYRGLGFQDTWSFQRYVRDGASAAGERNSVPQGLAIAPITGAEWPDVCAYDAAIFGADRSALLARLRGRAPAVERIARRNGRIAGFVLGRDGRVATQVGPLIAEDDETARALLAEALGAVTGRVFIDVADSRRDIVAGLAAHGFVAQRPLTRMLLGRDRAFDDGRRTYAVAGPEFG